jgi:hypothetical protein
VPLEAALVDRTYFVIAELLVLPQFRECEKLVFVREDFFISCAKITVSN